MSIIYIYIFILTYANIYDICTNIRYQVPKIFEEYRGGSNIAKCCSARVPRLGGGAEKVAIRTHVQVAIHIYVFLKTQYRQHKDAKSTEAEGVELEVAGNSIGVVDALHHGGPAREHLNETHPQEDLSHRALCMT